MSYYRDQKGIEAVGNRLREIRIAKGLSQEELANLCDLPPSQISRIETGSINTSISHIFLLAEKLMVAPKDIFDFQIK